MADAALVAARTLLLDGPQWSPNARREGSPAGRGAYLEFVVYKTSMDMKETEFSVGEARDHFSDAVDRAAFGGEITYVTLGRERLRVAAIVPADLVEHYEAMVDLEDGRIAQERLADLEAGLTTAVDGDEVTRALRGVTGPRRAPSCTTPMVLKELAKLARRSPGASSPPSTDSGRSRDDP